LNARDLALRGLLRVEEKGFSGLVWTGLLKDCGLDERDKAFATQLFYTTIERRDALDDLLRRHMKTRPEKTDKTLLCILRMGAAQLFYMDSVPDMAAVNESVTLAKKNGRVRQAGFVNAVLRACIRSGGAEKQSDDPDEILSRRTSTPLWLCRELRSRFGAEAAERFLAGTLGRAPVYLRANTRRITAQELAHRLTEEGYDVECLAEMPQALRLGGGDITASSTFAEGLFHVQDLASQLCVEALDCREDTHLLDVCAAPGGKSFTAAQTAQKVTSCDLHPRRVGLIEKGAARLGLDNVAATVRDAAVPDADLGMFDRILCDVPCSGFGVLRRKPEIKYKERESGLPALQLAILENASRHLAPGGRLIYSTCTVLREENEQVVEAFLAKHPDFTLVPVLPARGIHDTMHTFLPDDRFDCDGFFTAALERSKD